MATSQNQNLSAWDRVVAWYARHGYAVNMVYSLGASVVIIGALFKIMHWPGAGIVLTAGMCTEAFLFMIGIFEKPHAVYNWENVYPQLIGHEVKEVLGGSGVVGAPSTSICGTSLADGDMAQLQKGIADLSKTASQLADLSNVAEAANTLTAKMASATTATEKFAGAQEGLVAQTSALGQKYQTIATGMDEAVRQTQAYGQSIAGINTQVASLNSVYELQLKNIQSQAQAFNAQTEKINTVNASIDAMAANVEKMQAAAAETVKAGADYAENSKKLAEQIASLNKVYGNMLNALA